MNRHPADALADVRQEIRQLEAREQELRSKLLQCGGDDLAGDEWEAQVKHFDQQRLDTPAVVKHFGREALQPFFKSTAYDAVYLKRRQPRERGVATQKSPALGKPVDQSSTAQFRGELSCLKRQN
jgi:hypothetical protein